MFFFFADTQQQAASQQQQQQQLLLSMLMGAGSGGSQFLRGPLQPNQQSAILPFLLNQLSLGYNKMVPPSPPPPPPVQPLNQSPWTSTSCHFSNWKDVERVRSPENSSSRSSGVSCTSPSSRESPVDSGYGKIAVVVNTGKSSFSNLATLTSSNRKKVNGAVQRKRADQFIKGTSNEMAALCNPP